MNNTSADNTDINNSSTNKGKGIKSGKNIFRKLNLTWYTGLRYLIQTVYATLIITGIVYQSYGFIIALLVLPVIGGNFFCGWMCPFGTLQEWLGKLGSKITKRKLRLPVKIHRKVLLSRYILFWLLLFGVGVLYFVTDPYSTFQAFLSGNITYITTASIIILGAFLALSLFFERPFCTFLCIDGAKYGMIGMLRIFTIKRNRDLCNSCSACDRVCPSRIPISRLSQVRSAQCINCFECIRSCKNKRALSIRPVLPNIKELFTRRKYEQKNTR